MIGSMIMDPATRLLEQTVNFTEQRHQVILANIANLSTPGYVQQDVSVGGFQRALQDAVDRERSSLNDTYAPESNEDVTFEAGGSDVSVTPHAALDVMAFHDRGARSIEALQGDLADNALAHNMAVEMLKSKYDLVNRAIQMKP